MFVNKASGSTDLTKTLAAGRLFFEAHRSVSYGGEVIYAALSVR